MDDAETTLSGSALQMLAAMATGKARLLVDIAWKTEQHDGW